MKTIINNNQQYSNNIVWAAAQIRAAAAAAALLWFAVLAIVLFANQCSYIPCRQVPPACTAAGRAAHCPGSGAAPGAGTAGGRGRRRARLEEKGMGKGG